MGVHASNLFLIPTNELTAEEFFMKLIAPLASRNGVFLQTTRPIDNDEMGYLLDTAPEVSRNEVTEP